MKFVVIGGTGLIGSTIVEQLRQKGHEAIAASPSTGVDTITGVGLLEALRGAEVVIDVSNSPSFEDHVAMEFFETSGINLNAAEQAAGVRHHVALSIVGTELLQDSGYFRGKLAQERLVIGSPIPYSLVRATQFFEFVRTIALASTEGHTASLPPVLAQPIAAHDVARIVTEVATASPIRTTIEIAGPEVFTLHELVHKVFDFDNDTRKVKTDPAATYFGVKVTEHMLVPGNASKLGSITFDQWLRHVKSPATVG